jgi:hypothetical protein
MTRLILLVFTLSLAGCSRTVVRDRNVYESEVKLLSQVTKQASDLLAEEIGKQCVCSGSGFTTPWCQKSAETVIVSQVRVPWHTSMMLYLAGITDEKPGDVPAFPPVSSLCSTSTVAK